MDPFCRTVVLLYTGDDNEQVRQEIDMLGPTEPDPDNPNQYGNPASRFTEEQIDDQFENAYDQPKPVDAGYVDESDPKPHRYLKYWFFYNIKNSNKRLPLPANKQNLPKDHVLAGWLQPPPPPGTVSGKSENPEPVFVVFDNAKTFAIDRTPSLRGYWVCTEQNQEEKAWYWLQEPCDVKLLPDNKSQADVHFDARMVLAAVSLLCDQVFTLENALDYVGKPVEEVLWEKPLVPTIRIPRDDVFKTEKRLLAKYKSAIAMHLYGHREELTSKCTFMKTLSKLKVEPVQLLAKEKWVGAAEMRAGRYSWGGPRPTRSLLGLAFVVSNDRKVVLEVYRSDALLGLKGGAEKLLIDADDQVQAAFHHNDDEDEEDFDEDGSSYEEAGTEDSDASASSTTELSKKKRKLPSSPVGAKSDKPTKQRRGPQPEASGKRKAKEATPVETKRPGKADTHATKNPQKRPRAEQSSTGKGVDCSPNNSVAKKPKEPVDDVDVYCAKEMRKAAVAWSEYLAPVPHLSTFNAPWDEVQQKEFTLCADETKADLFWVKIADFDLESKRLELALLAVESLNKSFRTKSVHLKKVLSGMFKKKKGSKSPAVVIFEDFRNHALKTLKRRYSSQMTCAGTTAMYLLDSVVQLIANCGLIEHTDHLDGLKKRGVDWEQGIKEVRQISSHFPILEHWLRLADEKVRRVKATEKKTTVRDGSQASNLEADKAEHPSLASGINLNEKRNDPSAASIRVPTKDRKKGTGMNFKSLVSKCGIAPAKDLGDIAVPKKIRVLDASEGSVKVAPHSAAQHASNGKPNTVNSLSQSGRTGQSAWYTEKAATGWGNAKDVALAFAKIAKAPGILKIPAYSDVACRQPTSATFGSAETRGTGSSSVPVQSGSPDYLHYDGKHSASALLRTEAKSAHVPSAEQEANQRYKTCIIAEGEPAAGSQVNRRDCGNFARQIHHSDLLPTDFNSSDRDSIARRDHMPVTARNALYQSSGIFGASENSNASRERGMHAVQQAWKAKANEEKSKTRDQGPALLRGSQLDRGNEQDAVNRRARGAPQREQMATEGSNRDRSIAPMGHDDRGDMDHRRSGDFVGEPYKMQPQNRSQNHQLSGHSTVAGRSYAGQGRDDRLPVHEHEGARQIGALAPPIRSIAASGTGRGMQNTLPSRLTKGHQERLTG